MFARGKGNAAWNRPSAPTSSQTLLPRAISLYLNTRDYAFCASDVILEAHCDSKGERRS
jgi:hypothetical protein